MIVYKLPALMFLKENKSGAILYIIPEKSNPNFTCFTAHGLIIPGIRNQIEKDISLVAVVSY